MHYNGYTVETSQHTSGFMCKAGLCTAVLVV